MRGRNGTWHYYYYYYYYYYYCHNHDPLRAGGQDRRCPERNIRADALDEFVFGQVRAALLDPALLLAGEQAIAVHALCVPITSSTSCDQAVFVDQATDVSLSSDAVVVEIDRLG